MQMPLDSMRVLYLAMASCAFANSNWKSALKLHANLKKYFFFPSINIFLAALSKNHTKWVDDFLFFFLLIICSYRHIYFSITHHHTVRTFILTWTANNICSFSKNLSTIFYPVTCYSRLHGILGKYLQHWQMLLYQSTLIEHLVKNVASIF